MTDYTILRKALRCCEAPSEPDNTGCARRRCKYRDVDGACDIVSMCFDADDAIKQLQAQNQHNLNCYVAEHEALKSAQAENERLKKELDAAVEDMKNLAEDTDSPLVCEMCSRVVNCPTRDGRPCDFQWIGERTEQGDEDGKNG